MRPRSSTFAKKHLNCLYGVIDTDYSLELMLAVQLSGSSDLKIEFGEALGQIIPVRKETMVVSEITNAELDALVAAKNPIRTGGFGSTSK
jgi:dUTPase